MPPVVPSTTLGRSLFQRAKAALKPSARAVSAAASSAMRSMPRRSAAASVPMASWLTTARPTAAGSISRNPRSSLAASTARRLIGADMRIQIETPSLSSSG